MKKTILLLLLPYSLYSTAQISDTITPPNGGNPAPGPLISPSIYQPPNFWQNLELVSSLAILSVGTIILIVIVLAKPMQRLSNELHVRLIVVVLAVVAAMYLIAAGWNSEQTAPAFGLLGAIVGYILGKGDNHPSDNNAQAQ